MHYLLHLIQSSFKNQSVSVVKGGNKNICQVINGKTMLNIFLCVWNINYYLCCKIKPNLANWQKLDTFYILIGWSN